MPLSDIDKEKIRESETLKDEIRKVLQPAQPESQLSEFKKQTLLLLIGFALSTIAGGILADYWKTRESKNQRSYLAQQRALDKAYSIIDKTAKEVATTVAAADDVLTTCYGDEWTQKEIDERRENWVRTSRNWRVNSQVLSVEIASTFSSQEIDQMFQQIVQKRKLLGNIIINLPKGKKAMEADKGLKGELEDANTLKLEIADLLQKCSAGMTALLKQGAIQ